MEQNAIGERIRELRKEKNLTQDDLATRMNSSRVQINQWETGAREIPASRIIEFASALDTSCDFLLRGVPVDMSESYNRTGLDFNALSALSDVMELSEHRKKQNLTLLNGIIGSDYFWRKLMPHALSALTIQENAVLGGCYAGLKNFTPDFMTDKIKEGIQTLTFSNSAGYMDHILISKEAATAFQLQEAADAFKLLLKAIIEQSAQQKNGLYAAMTTPYRPNNAADEDISVPDFVDCLKSMGVTIDNGNT